MASRAPCALVAAAILAAASCATTTSSSTSSSSTGAALTGAASTGVVTVAFTGVDGVHCNRGPDRSRGARPLPKAAAAALGVLGGLEATGRGLPVPRHDTPTHDLVGTPANPRMSRADAGRLRTELRVAARAACGLLDTGSAERAGYYLGSPNVEGVGTHWIDWSAVNRPFDPARPSMLLFSAAGGESRLVGFSYWVRSATAPQGFAGGADAWHRHFGLCFDRAGQWYGDGETSAQCHGTYLNGRDLWMLHAWVVPGIDNPDGVFAPLMRSLCHPNVPDVARCPRPGALG